MGYVTPADVGISDNYWDHKNRDSAEPGTDYMTGYGTDIRIAGDGTVVYVDNSNDGAEGRRLQINMDNGEVIDYIHGSWINAWDGMRVGRGQTGVFFTGASGHGNDWYYGPHVHVTRRLSTGRPYWDSVNFEDAVGGDSGNGDIAPAHYPFPLPEGYYFGPKEGPEESVSGYYSHGLDLEAWQQRMQDRGWYITTDGLYGDQTKQVASDFQAEKGLTVDGLIGPETWDAAWFAPVT